VTDSTVTGSTVTDSTVADRPARAGGLDISQVDDGYVVYDPATDLVHHLNQTAAMVLELCTGQDSVAEISAFLAGVFPAAEAVPDAVLSCVAQLRDLGVLRPAAGTGAR
jgi:Coenzyme PQQ synthesis protein D (PqqD)